ncbi:MAG: hypothetical protein JXA11_03540 [Phycisphaerae bacterium]|nr:hypothetical protein [Phycisphaerae bacterium]
MSLTWKENWEQTKRRFLGWWNRKDLVVSFASYGGIPTTDAPHEVVPEIPDPPSREAGYLDVENRVRRNHYKLSRDWFPAETLPLANTMMGPGSLALFLGSEPGFAESTVWFKPCLQDVEKPEELPPLKFNPESRWWKLTEETHRRQAELARGKYLAAYPDLVENVDILAALRDPQKLMFDLIERPEWVERSVMEINRAFFEAVDRLYEIIRQPDGSSAFAAFGVWGPGKVAKVQCDASAMFSPAMFRRFVMPALTEQCDWLDHSLYHLDGTQAMCHLDALLEIESLGAIEWTPQTSIERGGNPRWFDMYKRILAAGKCVQAIGVKPEEVIPLLDAVGPEGMYLFVSGHDARIVEDLLKRLEPYYATENGVIPRSGFPIRVT